MVVSFVVAIGALGAPIAHAQPASATQEAGKHFNRGVALYNEADYRAALVEFKRAYEIAPNAGVLYNIGQAHYQLQNYAAALTTFERYLAEAGATASHRAEVEQAVETLRSRVGKLEATTNIAGCEITIDDELVGKTPLAQPLLTSIGRRKVTAICHGHPAQSRFHDVAAGDTAKVAFAFAVASTEPAKPPPPPPEAPRSNRLLIAGWTTAGVLAAAAVTAGVFAYRASSDLDDARNTAPADPNDLSDKASRVQRWSIAGDALGAAALIAGGITLYLTLSRDPPPRERVGVGVSPRGVHVTGRF